jgi:hypothetical protein
MYELAFLVFSYFSLKYVLCELLGCPTLTQAGSATGWKAMDPSSWWRRRSVGFPRSIYFTDRGGLDRRVRGRAAWTRTRSVDRFITGSVVKSSLIIIHRVVEPGVHDVIMLRDAHPIYILLEMLLGTLYEAQAYML